jgi:stringent starvation protein B
MATFKKKPTNKEMANAIVEINNRVNEIANVVYNLDNVMGMFIRMEGKLEKFNEYLKEKAKEMENDSKADGEAAESDIQKDTDDESSGTEGVRKEDK